MPKFIYPKPSCLFLFCSLVITASLSLAEALPSYYNQHAEGWNWYHDFLLKKNTSTEKVTTTTLTEQLQAAKNISDPIAHVKVISHVLLEARDQMTLNPTLENIQFYLALQNQVSSQASLLRENWQQLLLNQPGMNFNLAHPTSAWANSANQQQQNRDNMERIEAFSKHYGLLFFYRGTCPHCHHFAPVLADFIQRYHLSIIPITLDGRMLPDFPNSKVDQGQAQHLHVNEVPALFAVNPVTEQVISLGAGDRTEDELSNDLLTAIRYTEEHLIDQETSALPRSVME